MIGRTTADPSRGETWNIHSNLSLFEIICYRSNKSNQGRGVDHDGPPGRP